MKLSTCVQRIFQLACLGGVITGWVMAGGNDPQDTKAGKILSGYLDGVSLLAKDDLAGAISAFKKFKADFGEMKYSGIDTDKKTTALRILAITESKTLEEARKALSPLSESVILLKLKVNLGPPANYYYCSMNGAYWASASDKIQNPYHGTSQLTCGVKVDTLK